MKRLYTYITILALALATFCSCAEEELICSFVESGNDVTLKLNVQTQANNNITVSRATDIENKLYDLHFYVFDANGDLTGYEKFVDDDGNITSPGPVNVTIRTKTGESYIFALANINRGNIYKLSQADKELLNVVSYATNNKTSSDDVKALKDAVKASTLNLTTFRNITFNRALPTPGGNEVISPSPSDNIFLMSGYLNEGAAVTIQKSGTTVSIKEGVNLIKLYRILAKNTLTINSPIDATTQRPKFTLKSYRLHNVPVGGQLVPNANISTANNAADADYVKGNITTVDVESHYEGFTNESSFVFYYPENLQKTEANITKWEERETNSYTDTGSKIFTNAPAKAAYIEIKGDYVDNAAKLTASVSYTIHLGNFGDTEKGGSLTNFDVIRNNNYIYTITINGVNDIKAEAQVTSADHNDNPYAEGFVVHIGDGEHLDVDAHYEARVLKFTKADIQKLKNLTNTPGYIFNVSTPFGSMVQTVNVKSDGVYTIGNDKICTIEQATDIDNPDNKDIKARLFGNGEADFRWIRFVRNTTANVTKANNNISEYTCKYPGDQNRYDASSKPGGWMNVFELLAQLYNEGTYTNNNNTEAYYTCFIDENYYPNKQWSTYVNQEPRTMQIADKLEISEDKKSVYAEATYSISQQSIATFYKNNNLVAFGTEIIDEEDKYSKAPYNYQDVRMGKSGSTDKYEIFPPSTTNADNWNGYTNAVKTNQSDSENVGWYNHQIRTGGNYSPTYTNLVNLHQNIQPLYGAVGKACMSRNRDNDGDGKIDANEVRWYLASAQQYHALGIAKNSLPAESHLISDTELQAINTAYTTNVYGRPNTWNNGDDPSGHDFRGKYHYYTSSPKDAAGTFWPEEGLTSNGVSEESGFVQRAELVRCVRTLENDGEGLMAPQKYYTYNEIAPNTFDLSGIETRRAAITEAPYVLPNHHELQDMNELYRKFEVATRSLNYTYSLLNLSSQETDPCTNYSQQTDGSDRGTWRTPNQKELALMLAVIPDAVANHGARTRFSATINDNNPSVVSWHGPYSWHQRYGFAVGATDGKFNVSGNDYINGNKPTNVNIRCVRDIP